MAEVRIKGVEEQDIDTILAEDIDFEGQLTFQKPLMIKGKFKGDINSKSALHVGEKAYVEATVEAGLVSSRGRIKGDIVGHSRVELFSTAQVDGDICTPDLVAESGCKFNGMCNMSGNPVRKDPHVQQVHGGSGQPQAKPQANGQPHPQNQQAQQNQAQQRPANPQATNSQGGRT